MGLRAQDPDGPWLEVVTVRDVRVYAIADLQLEDRNGLGQTIGDLHLSRAEAEAWLDQVLADEPTWVDRLRVVEFELDGARQ